MKKTYLLSLLLLLPLSLLATEVKSPNGNLVLTFTIEQGRPVYTLKYKGHDVIKPSHLGLELA